MIFLVSGRAARIAAIASEDIEAPDHPAAEPPIEAMDVPAAEPLAEETRVPMAELLTEEPGLRPRSRLCSVLQASNLLTLPRQRSVEGSLDVLHALLR